MRHYINQDMLSLLDNEQYSLTISVIGIGGTGSVFAIGLAKICYALHSLGKSLPLVRLYDNDIISEANISRIAGVYEDDIGKRKSDVLVEKINRSFGFNWLSKGNYPQDIDSKANITISCVDTVKSRKDIINNLFSNNKQYEHLYYRPYYLIDNGNSDNYGQVIVSTILTSKQPKSSHFTIEKLPTIFDIFGNVKEDKNSSSCSLRDALSKQDLFTNSFIANIALATLWNMLTKYYIDKQQFYINLETMEMK